MNKTNWIKILTVIAIAAAICQTALPESPIHDQYTINLLTVVFMSIASIATAWKQFLSTVIKNGALFATLAVALVGTLGGLNEILNIVHLSQGWSEWLKFIIVGAISVLNLTSKALFPTPEAKAQRILKKEFNLKKKLAKKNFVS